MFQYPSITVCMYRDQYWNYQTNMWEMDYSDFINNHVTEFPKELRTDLIFDSIYFSNKSAGLVSFAKNSIINCHIIQCITFVHLMSMFCPMTIGLTKEKN